MKFRVPHIIPMLWLTIVSGYLAIANAQPVFPPKTGKNDAAAAGLTVESVFPGGVPDNDPIRMDGKSRIRPGQVGRTTFLEAIPIRGEFKVLGGSFETIVGSVHKRAQFTDWDLVYPAVGADESIAWAALLTKGELIISRSLVTQQPRRQSINNYFALEDFGPHFYLINLDPTKGHRLGIFRDNSGRYYITTDFIGTRIDVGGKIIERKEDGWYAGSNKVTITQ